MPVRLTVNGAAREFEAREGETLLDLLRLDAGLLSPKRGCQPLGQCGACVAIVGGEARSTCTIPAAACGGLEVLTVEGLPGAERSASRARSPRPARRSAASACPGS